MVVRDRNCRSTIARREPARSGLSGARSPSPGLFAGFGKSLAREAPDLVGGASIHQKNSRVGAFEQLQGSDETGQAGSHHNDINRGRIEHDGAPYRQAAAEAPPGVRVSGRSWV